MSEEKEEGSHQYMEQYPLGYRFVPNDQQLLLYLLWKVKGESIPPGLIQDADIYERNPFQLPGMDTEEKYTYFFTRRERKYPNGFKTDRSTRDGKGYWKITSKLTPIFVAGNLQFGKKNVLVYYLKTPKGQNDIKTNWIMHELELNKSLFPRHASEEKFNDFIVCRIHDREKRKGNEQLDMVNSLIEPKQVMNHNNGEPLRSTKRKFKTNKTIITSHDPQNVGMKSNYLYNGHELQATAASDFDQTKTSSADIMSTIMANPIVDNHPHQVVQHTHVTGDQNVYLSNNNNNNNNNNISSVFPRDVYLSGEQNINSGHRRLVKNEGNAFNDPKLECSTSQHMRGDESIPLVPENDCWPPSEEFWDGLPDMPPMDDFSNYMDLLDFDLDQTQPKTLF
ncbi:PREDICTED: NAC domain-containing protein 55-like [Nicotiana attenuata]|uniref:NAC domain-containing protein 55-like n=1 Tax=Nicotiana attenuata TaxID=49451 RepID=UPI000905B849|nr:PREDICTED: NAC domain-containing protein 55-like [Nicotiana attenuata]